MLDNYPVQPKKLGTRNNPGDAIVWLPEGEIDPFDMIGKEGSSETLSHTI